MLDTMVADLLVLFHFTYIIFVVLGGLLTIRWRKIIWLHIPATIWGAVAEFTGRICPLTPLEQWFRIRAGEIAYTEGFIEHYLLPILYPENLTREIQMVLGTFVVVVNIVIYGYVFLRKKPKLLDTKQS